MENQLLYKRGRFCTRGVEEDMGKLADNVAYTTERGVLPPLESSVAAVLSVPHRLDSVIRIDCSSLAGVPLSAVQ